MDITTLDVDRKCNYCQSVFTIGSSYLVVLHHLRYCAKNPQCKIVWCFACKTRLKGMDKITEHFKSMEHRKRVGAEDPSKKLKRLEPEENKLLDTFVRPLKNTKPREEGMEKNETAKENWKKSFDPWTTSGASPQSLDFFSMKGKKFDVIVIDPPWGFDRRWTKSSALHHYPTMKDKDIYAIPLQQLAAENCMLLVWGLDTKVPEALKAIEEWGFKFKKMFMVWLKVFKNKKTPVCGMGNYTRGCTEHIYLASRGRITQFRDARDISQLLIAPRRGHSEKPIEFWKALEKYFGSHYSGLHKIEIFARQKRDGWHCWGNEVAQ